LISILFQKVKNYPYQREALENALKILYKFYQNNSKKDNEALKKDFLKLAEHNGLAKNNKKNTLPTPTKKAKRMKFFQSILKKIQINCLPFIS
jgi:hypothetical protein